MVHHSRIPNSPMSHHAPTLSHTPSAWQLFPVSRCDPNGTKISTFVEHGSPGGSPSPYRARCASVCIWEGDAPAEPFCHSFDKSAYLSAIPVRPRRLHLIQPARSASRSDAGRLLSRSRTVTCRLRLTTRLRADASPRHAKCNRLRV
jgi:hypothetical protein